MICFQVPFRYMLIVYQAIVNGVNLISYPGTTMMLGTLGVLSPDGKCFSFDHRANGYGRGEGVGTVIVKRLDAALRDGNTIRAIVRATGSNQDGRTPGIALPSGPAQERLIRHVYKTAGLDMGLTRYVEAHGTGTAAGDPIEAGAIAAAFNTSGSGSQPIYIGSIKSNMGHLEPAAGIAGLIKAILMVERGVIPPAANFEKVNSKIPLEEWNMRIATSPVPWPPGVRRVSINSFGFGGTNAHVVIDDASSFLVRNSLKPMHTSTSTINREYSIIRQNSNVPLSNVHSSANGNGVSVSTSSADCLTDGHASGHGSPLSNGASRQNRKTDFHTVHNNGEDPSRNRVFVFSTPDEAGIKLNASKLSEHLRSQSFSSPEQESQYLDDLAYTLAEKRSMYKWKAFCIASSEQDLVARLENAISKPVQKSRCRAKVGFVFTG
jgi:acyl transferase domain-containing protein